MKLKVLYFGAAKERAGTAAEIVELPDDPSFTVSEALEAIWSLHPSLRPLAPHLRVALDQSFVETTQPLANGCELALIPPVAGGSDAFRVQEEALSVEKVLQQVESSGLGGVVTFIGRVRDSTRGRKVVRLEYEAYAPMAEKVFAQIAQEAVQKWPECRMAIHHRSGTLVPGEVAVVIAAAAPHRKEAFLACEHGIERLKQDAPIWKKEHYEDGAVWVGLGP